MRSMKALLLVGAAALLAACTGGVEDASSTEAAAQRLFSTAPVVEAAPAEPTVVGPKPAESQKLPSAKVEERMAGSANSARPTKGYSSSKYGAEEPSDPRFSGFRSMADQFPWGQAGGGTWSGSGVGDPEPLKEISNEEMLKRATSVGFSTDRLNALVSVGRRKVPGALDAIEQALVPSEDQMVRIISVSALVEHGGEQALELLWNKGFTDPDGGIRGQAIWGIALYGHDEALKGIRAGLEDEDPGTRGMAILATTALRDEEVTMGILEPAIRSSEKREYQEAAYVLSNVPTTRARRLLSDAYDEATDEKRLTLRYYLKSALRNRVPRAE